MLKVKRSIQKEIGGICVVAGSRVPRENAAGATRTLAGVLGRTTSKKISQHLRDRVRANTYPTSGPVRENTTRYYQVSNDATKHVRDHGSTQVPSPKNPMFTSNDPGHRVKILQ